MKIDAALPKKIRILQAAEQVFSRLGYEKATLDEIIQLADVGKGTVYKYFGSKEGLFYQLVADKNEPFVERLRWAVEGDKPLEVRLRKYFKEMIDFYVENNPLWQIICFEMLSASNGCRVIEEDGELQVVARFSQIEIDDALREKVLRYHKLLYDEYIIVQEIVEQAMEAGVMKHSEEGEIVSKFLFFGVAMGIFNPSHYICGHYTSEELAQIIVNRFLWGHGAMPEPES